MDNNYTGAPIGGLDRGSRVSGNRRCSCHDRHLVKDVAVCCTIWTGITRFTPNSLPTVLVLSSSGDFEGCLGHWARRMGHAHTEFGSVIWPFLVGIPLIGAKRRRTASIVPYTLTTYELSQCSNPRRKARCAGLPPHFALEENETTRVENAAQT